MDSRTLNATLGLTALLLLVTQAPAGAHGPPDHSADHPVEVEINSVLAANTDEGTDAALQSMSRQLARLFRYTTYRLLNHQVAKTRCGEENSFSLPGGRILHVYPRSFDGHMIAMQLVLFQGERPIMSTDLKLSNGGVLMVGGPHYEQGMLIIVIAAEAPLLPSEVAAARTATPRATPR